MLLRSPTGSEFFYDYYAGVAAMATAVVRFMLRRRRQERGQS